MFSSVQDLQNQQLPHHPANGHNLQNFPSLHPKPCAETRSSSELSVSSVTGANMPGMLDASNDAEQGDCHSLAASTSNRQSSQLRLRYYSGSRPAPKQSRIAGSVYRRHTQPMIPHLTRGFERFCQDHNVTRTASIRGPMEWPQHQKLSCQYTGYYIDRSTSLRF